MRCVPAFKDMDDLKGEIHHMAGGMLGEYIGKAMNYTPAVKQTGRQIIQFAIDEPNLFKLVFMPNNGECRINNC